MESTSEHAVKIVEMSMDLKYSRTLLITFSDPSVLTPILKFCGQMLSAFMLQRNDGRVYYCGKLCS